MATLDKWLPKIAPIRDPRDTKKKSGMFSNWPRYLYFGGAPHAPRQDGTKGPDLNPESGNSISPINDRGKGRK